MAEVRFDKFGFALVRVWIGKKSGFKKEQLLYKVDTGANVTTISRDWLNQLGYDDNWIKTGRLLVGDERPSVATGEPVDNCYEVILPEIRIGIWTGPNWPFIVSLDKNIQFRLLFGTNSMRFFSWALDFERGVFRYEAIPNKRQSLFNGQEQSIHSIDNVV